MELCKAIVSVVDKSLVAVEKLISSEFAKMKLRQDAL